MKYLVFGLALMACCLGFAQRASAASDLTPDQLIDQLAEIDCNGPGLYNNSPYQDFWAVLGDDDRQMHLTARPPNCIPEAMSALVRLGPQALPALIRHVSDPRPTSLKVGSKIDPNDRGMGGQDFTGEYEPRAHAYHELGVPFAFSDQCDDGICGAREFYEPYTIKVGDVCFVLIGQIVNRQLVAAHYQMTGFVIVNSPIMTPTLADKVRADWTSLDAEGLKASLLADLHMPILPKPPGYKRRIRDDLTYEQVEASALRQVYAGALRRLRFYYPDTYASLSGDNLAKRQAFEQEEAKTQEEEAQPDQGPMFTIAHLIDELTTLNCPIPGISDAAIEPGFLVEDGSMEQNSTVLFEEDGGYRFPAFCNNNAASALVWGGARSLPLLLRHLDDRRPTELVAGRRVRGKPETTSSRFFADEYDARQHVWMVPSCNVNCTVRRPFETSYTVTVGDVCFVLIGQIVNRQLSAVRYDPSGIVLVNSPTETPTLAKRVRSDWAGVDGEGLKASLLADIHAERLAPGPGEPAEAAALRVVQWGALRRLRFYFPDAYGALSGDDLKKRLAFEHAERHPEGQ